MLVKAIAKGFFGGRLYREGETFDLPEHLTPGKWMRAVASPKKPLPAQKKAPETPKQAPETADLV